MRYFTIIFSCLLILTGCTDDTDSGASGCPECAEWEICDATLEICRPADGYCNSDQHCLDPRNSACHPETHRCVPDLCLINPCVQFQGSNKSKCELDSSAKGYRCICDSGYIEIGGVCVKDEDSPCQPNPCIEAHRTLCEVSGDRAVCSCEPGYALEDEKCVMKDLCDPNPCKKTHEMNCEVLGDKAVCLCDINYHRDEDGACVSNSVCDPNPCPDPLMSCIDGGAAINCICPTGYIKQGDRCVVDVHGPCDDVVCSDPNAICIAEGDIAGCICKDGYQKNSEGICVASCVDQCAIEGSSCLEGINTQRGICYYNEQSGCLERAIITCPEGRVCKQSYSGASCVDPGCDNSCDPDLYPRCENGEIVLCELFNGCYKEDLEPCDDGEICQGGEGSAFCGPDCGDTCNPDHYPICGSYNSLTTCIQGTDGCYREITETCENNRKCRYTPEGATCNPPLCSNSCNPGDYPKCSSDATQVLVCDDFNGDGCFEEQVAATCSSGKSCQIKGGHPGCHFNCTDQCNPEEQRYNWCSDDKRSVLTCEKQANGCYHIITWETCSYSGFCEVLPGGAICNEGCEHQCDPAQLSVCNDTKTAIIDCGDTNGDGCFEPVTRQCGADQICTIGSAGAICVNSCINECSPSSYPRCNTTTNSIERCIDSNNDGCYQLITTGCDTGTVCHPETISCVSNSCFDGIDDDGDGWIDSEDPDCLNGLSERGFGSTACNDGDDNDRDKMIDRQDPGCDSALDNDESGGIEPDNCNNGKDDDNDGWIDILDPDCALGDTEQGFGYTQCNDGIDNDHDGYIDSADSKCDFAYQIQEGEAQVDNCSDGIDNDGDGWSDIEDPDCMPLIGAGGEIGFGSFECNDGIDNDKDGKTDKDDSNCLTALQPSEGADNSNCSDGIDNDGDGWPDEKDPDCIPLFGSGKEQGYGTTECNDGVDNNGNWLKDQWDPNCLLFDTMSGGYGALGKESSLGPDIDIPFP